MYICLICLVCLICLPAEQDDEPVDWDAILEAKDMIQAPMHDELVLVGSTFSRFTAIGCDDVHPKHVTSMSSRGLACFAVLVHAMLRTGMIPKALELMMIALLPKPTGGTRPIGIFASCLRIIGRWARWKIAVHWERSNPRPYWFAERDRSCEMCV